MNIEEDQLEDKSKWIKYYESVKKDFYELKESYPFVNMFFPPTSIPSIIKIQALAIDRTLIEVIGGIRTDFLGEFSKEILILVPLDYRKVGCTVYGMNWKGMNRIECKDRHFYIANYIKDAGYELCVGTPNSFEHMKNVILENVKTADNMLVAYEKYLRGITHSLELNAYPHGDEGIKQFEKDKTKYITKG